MLWGISEMVNARAFQPLSLCSASLITVLVVISEALRNAKKANLYPKTGFVKMM